MSKVENGQIKYFDMAFSIDIQDLEKRFWNLCAELK